MSPVNRLLFTLALALGGCAAEQAATTMSPDSVAADINGADLAHLKGVWHSLGINSQGPSPIVFNPAGRPATYANGPFSADVISIDLDGLPRGVQGGSDALVRVADPAAWDWQLLAFTDSDDGWRFVGNVDLPDYRTGAPVAVVHTLGPGRSWLTIRTSKSSIGALTEAQTSWRQLRNGRLVEVLRAPAEGRRVGVTLPFDSAYHADLLDLFLTPENIPVITLRVEAVYSNARRDSLPGVGELFRRSGVVRYQQDPVTGRFRLDQARSDFRDDELAGLLTDSADEFVRLNRVQITAMGRSGDRAKRDWLTRLRQDCRTDTIRDEVTAMVTDDSQY